MYQVAVEGVLGLRRHGSTFSVNPSIPAMWPAFSLEWSLQGTRYRIDVANPEHRCAGVGSATLDGAEVDPLAIPIVEDQRVHHIEVVLGEKRPVQTADLALSRR